MMAEENFCVCVYEWSPPFRYMEPTCVPGDHRGQKRAWGPQALELQMVVSQHMGAGNGFSPSAEGCFYVPIHLSPGQSITLMEPGMLPSHESQAKPSLFKEDNCIIV